MLMNDTYEKFESYPQAPDEISLRELWLILRRALPWVLFSAAIVGAITFVVLSLQEDQFEASSAVTITSAPVRSTSGSGEPGLVFEAELPIDVETYRRNAMSNEVLTAVVQESPHWFDQYSTDSAISAIKSFAQVEPIEVNDPQTFLVDHTIQHPVPTAAAELSIAWAKASVSSVRGMLNDTYSAIAATTTDSLRSRKADLIEAEDQLEKFDRTNNLDRFRQQSDQIQKALNESQNQLQSLRLELSMANTRMQSIQNQIIAEANTFRTVGGAQLQSQATSGGSATSLEGETRQLLREANERIIDFELENDLSLLEGSIAQDEDTVIRNEARIEASAEGLRELEAELQIIEAQLARTSPTITLNDRLSIDQIAANVFDGGAKLQNLDVTRQIPSENYVSLRERQNRIQSEWASLEAAKTNAEAAKQAAEERLEMRRARFTSLSNEYNRLTQTYDELASVYEGLVTSSNNRLINLLSEEQDLAIQISALNRNINELSAQQSQNQLDLSALQEKLAVLSRSRADLIRERDDAAQAYASVSELAPTITYLSQLTTAGARVVSQAAIPGTPVGNSAFISSVLTAVVTAMALTLFAFLREAVRDTDGGDTK